jgi:hypothetical protein
METVANIFLKSDTAFEVNEISQIPLVLDNNNYSYFLTLYSFSFLNSSPNVYDHLSFDYVITTTNGLVPPTLTDTTYHKDITAGIYDSDDLINLLNSYFLQTVNNVDYQPLRFIINPITEKTEIHFDQAAANTLNITNIKIIMNSNSILNNELFRFNTTTDLNFNSTNTYYQSSQSFRVSTYNNVLLTSSSIPGLVSLYGNDNGITTSSALYVVSSVASPYSMIEYVALQPIDFPINNVSSLSNFQFKLIDENNQDLKLLEGGSPDFSIKLAIKRRRR